MARCHEPDDSPGFPIDPIGGKVLVVPVRTATVSRLAVALVVCLVLTAGCSGFSGADGSPDREPYGVEEEMNASIKEGPEELLPGLTTEGIADSEELRESHEEVIGNRSYVLEIETENVFEDGNESVRQTINSTLYVDPEAEIVHETVHQRFEGNISIVSPQADVEPNRTVERWFGEETAFRTELENGSVEYTPSRDGMRRGHDRIDEASIYLLAPLPNEETTTAGAVESEEGTYYVVEVETNASGDELGPGLQESEAEARTLVREDGLVRQTASERVHVHGEGERTLVAQTVEITAIGETTVERPDWYEEAVAAGSGEPEPENPPGEESERASNDTPADDAESDDGNDEE